MKRQKNILSFPVCCPTLLCWLKALWISVERWVRKSVAIDGQKHRYWGVIALFLGGESIAFAFGWCRLAL